jgi:hypothetical protein
MNRKRARFAPAVSAANEILESRVVLSASVAHQSAVEVAGHAVRGGPTQTTLTVDPGTLGQPITFTVTVRGRAAAGAPRGTINLTDGGTLNQTLTLSPTTSTNRRFAYSSATYTFTPQPGGAAYYFGKHPVSATFEPSGMSRMSKANQTFIIAQPTYTTLANGVQVATIANGSGPAIQSGQVASVLYTGYLTSNGQIFDDSAIHGGTPFSFTVGSAQVIPGFDAAVVGMKVGETRIVTIPPAQGYGSTAAGSIPANSTLTFVLTLKGIS